MEHQGETHLTMIRDFLKDKHKLFLAGLILAGIFAGWVIFYATSLWGPGLLDWDSFNYVASARNLADGKGLTIPFDLDEIEPMTHYPPLFPVLLAGGELVGVDAIQGARWLNILLYSLCTMALGWTIWTATRSRVFALVGAALFVLSGEMVVVFYYALSEPLLMGFTVLTFWFLGKYLLNEEKTADLVYASIFACCAFLSKYAGVAVVATVGAVVLLVGKSKFKERITRTALALGIGLLPGIGWAVRNYMLTDTLNHRTLGYYPVVIKNFVSTYYTVYSWFIPQKILKYNEKLLFLSSLAVIGVVLGFLLYDHYRETKNKSFINALSAINPLVVTYAVFGIFFLMVVYGSKMFVDPNIGFSDRMLAPLLLSLVVIIASVSNELWKNRRKIFKGFAVLGTLSVLAYASIGAGRKIPQVHKNGEGLSRRGMQNAKSIKLIREMTGEEIIYTDYPIGMYLLTKQTGYRFSQFDQLEVPPEGVIFASFRVTGFGSEYIVYYAEGLTLLVEDKIADVYRYLPQVDK